MRTLLLPLGLAALLHSPFLQAEPATHHSNAATAALLTLDDALGFAESRGITLSGAQKEREAIDGSVLQAGLWRNPEFNAVVEDTRRATRTSTATVSIPIELGDKRAARLQAAERSRDVADAALANARAQLRASVVEAFFGVLVAQERRKLAHAATELATRATDVARKRVAAGRAPPLDEVRARVDRANARLAMQEAESELQNTREQLGALWGDSAPLFLAVQGDIDAIPSRPSLPEISGRLDESPALAAIRLEIDRRKALLDVERSKRHADLTFSVGARRDNQLGLTQAVVGVSIPLQLFDRNQGNIYEAAKRADQAGDDYAAARVAALNALQRAARQLELAATSARILKTEVLPAAEVAYSTATQGFEAGKFAFLDVLDAQRALLQARSRYLTSLSGAHQAATAIDRLFGR